MRKYDYKQFKNFNRTATIPHISEFLGREQNASTINKMIRLWDKNTLLQFTEGYGNIFKLPSGGSKEGIAGRKYSWKVEGVPSHVTYFATDAPADYNLGRNFQEFNICLQEEIANENDILILANEQQLFVLNNAVDLGDGKYQYRVRYNGNDVNEAIDFNYISTTKSVSVIGDAQPELSRKGYYNERRNGSMRVNYLQKMRRGIELSGDAAAAKWVICDTASDGKEHVIGFMSEMESKIYEDLMLRRELALIFSECNVNPETDRVMGLSSMSEEHITTEGVYTQIKKHGMHDYYSRLSEGLLQEIITNIARRNPTKTLQGMKIVAMTGLQGLAEVQRLGRSLSSQFNIISDNLWFHKDKEGNKFGYGSQMTSFNYMGATITFAHNPIFDNLQLLADDVDAQGFPRRSSMFLILDVSEYNGTPNIKSITKDGCNLITGHTLGFGGKDGKTSGSYSTRVHGLAYDAMTYAGSIVHLPETCMILQKSFV